MDLSIIYPPGILLFMSILGTDSFQRVEMGKCHLSGIASM